MRKSFYRDMRLTRCVGLLLLPLALCQTLCGQFQGRTLLTEISSELTDGAAYTKGCTERTILHFDRSVAEDLLLKRPLAMVLDIPGTKSLSLDLFRAEISSKDIRITTASGKVVVSPNVVHYRGKVHNDSTSIVAITVSADGVMGVIGTSDGDRVLGKLSGDQRGRHLIYAERSLQTTKRMRCATDTDSSTANEHGMPVSDRSMRCVRAYWEAKYDLYSSMGGAAGTAAYLQGLFNQMATLYANDDVELVLSELFIWDRADPYVGPNMETTLYQFKTLRTSFDADHAMLIGLGGQGGIAHFNSLCGQTIRAMAYSSIETSFENVPLYSWTVETLAHETGHVLGSRHTHACKWNGNMTAIDGCGPLNGFVEGNCPSGPIPPPEVGGTIMSYCHLTDAGINFANGFGPQPSEVIRYTIDHAVCLELCGQDCDPPFGLDVVSVSSSSVILTWRNSGAPSYNVEWKPASTTAWNVVLNHPDTSLQLTELVPGTTYDFRVFNNCGSHVSDVSINREFTTLAPCPDLFEPNDGSDQATAIAFASLINARVGSPSDIDHYHIVVPQAGRLRITTSLDASQYEVLLLDTMGTQLMAAEPMLNAGYAWIDGFPAEANAYVIRVGSTSGTFQSGDCYTLRSTLTIECPPVPTPSVSGISYNSAQIGLPLLPEFPEFDIARRRVGTSAWLLLEDRSPPSAWLSPLTPNATYEVFLRARCSPIHEGYGLSDTVQFSTTIDPCGTWVLARPKAFLDCAYDTASGLMSDLLRTQGLLPLEEPYLALGVDVIGERNTTEEVFATEGPDAIVDWILVGIGPSVHTLRYRAALLQRDGDVVSVDGSSPIKACIPPGQHYHIGITHRNHLGCRTGPLYFPSDANTQPVEFDLTTEPEVYQYSSRNEQNGVYTLWCGDVNTNGRVRYTGPGNDREPLLLLIGSTTPFAIIEGYHREDANLDGKVKYVGPANDRDAILRTVGGDTPDGQRSSF